jgi:hypothetical protein
MGRELRSGGRLVRNAARGGGERLDVHTGLSERNGTKPPEAQEFGTGFMTSGKSYQ